MLRRVVLVIAEVSEVRSASIIRVTRVGELGTTLIMEALSSSETSVLTRVTQRNIPEDGILHVREYCEVNEFAPLLLFTNTNKYITIKLYIMRLNIRKD
jgi:hypothetical protein